MRVLKVEPGREAYEKEIENSLSSIQAELGGGLFQPVYMGGGIILCCNEEGKLNGMDMNQRIDGDIICEPFFLVAEDGDDFTSLSDGQMELCKDC